MIRQITLLVSIVLGISIGPMRTTANDESSALSQVIIVVGAGGEIEYEAEFRTAAEKWIDACQAAKLSYKVIGLQDDSSESNSLSDREILLAELKKWSIDSASYKWIVMIGHGTSTKQASNFNLRGDDISVSDLKQLLSNVGSPVVIAACFSTSGAWIPELAASDRTVVAATKSGAEINYSRFAKYFAESIYDMSVDLDHDKEVSLLEAFLSASRKTERFYAEDNRLASEHAIIDDNGDGKGTTVDFYEGLQLKPNLKTPTAVDGANARKIVLVPNLSSQSLGPDDLAERDQLEKQIEVLKTRKSTMSPDEYYSQLEQVFLRLAKLYSESANSELPKASAETIGQ